jgi:hypothetical protein
MLGAVTSDTLELTTGIIVLPSSKNKNSTLTLEFPMNMRKTMFPLAIIVTLLSASPLMADEATVKAIAGILAGLN